MAPEEWVHALSLLALQGEEDQPYLLDQPKQEDGAEPNLSHVLECFFSFLKYDTVWLAYQISSIVISLICFLLAATFSKCKEGEVNSGRDIKITKEQDDVWWRMKEESTLIWGTAKLWTAIRARLISSELKGICRQQEEGERKERQENGSFFFLQWTGQRWIHSMQVYVKDGQGGRGNVNERYTLKAALSSFSTLEWLFLHSLTSNGQSGTPVTETSRLAGLV